MQKTSLYNKIQTLLVHVKDKSFSDKYDFSEYISKKKIAAFEVPTKGKAKKYCEPSTVRKAIDLAVKLGLIENAGNNLTADGLTAARNDNSFKNILGAQIISYLNENKLGITRILETIDGIQRPEFPEAETIFEEVKGDDTEIDEEEFRRLLYLLYLCDKLDRPIKYLYLRRKGAE
jgi:hypothetical protein